jgi:hypothetical protein
MAMTPRLMQSPASRQQLLASSLTNQAMQPRNIQSPMQGYAQLAQALFGGLNQRKADQMFETEQTDNAAKTLAQLNALNVSPSVAAAVSGGSPAIQAAAIGLANEPTFRELTPEELQKYSSAGYPEDLLKLARVGSDNSIKFPPKLASAPKASLITLEKDGEKKTLTAGAVVDIEKLIRDGWIESRAPAVQVNTAPTGYEPDPDNPGALRSIAGGPGDKFSKGEAKSASFANRMFAVIPDLEDPELVAALLNPGQAFVTNLPGGNFIASAKFQRANRAVTDFINAQLREESGAVIGPTEFANAYEQYIPKPGDKPEVLAAKAKARREASENMALSAGRKYKRPKGFEVPEKVGF